MSHVASFDLASYICRTLRLALVIDALLTPGAAGGITLGGAAFAATTAGGSGPLAGVAGAVDDVWVWSRAVEACELTLLRGAGQDFALAFGSATVVGGAG